jgi:hypothetical protein
MLDGVVFSCQQTGVNTFYKCIELTRADNSGYTNHMVICLVVIGSSFDSFKWIPLIVFEKWTLTKNLTKPDADAGVTTIAQLFFFEKSS